MIVPDISNYTPNFTLDQAINWRDNLGIRKVIIQAVIPPPGYPTGKTKEQIQIALDAGLKVGIYFFHWYEDIPGGLDQRISLLNGYNNAIDDYYLDVEDTYTGLSWSIQDRMDSVNRALYTLDRLPNFVEGTRMYSGRWYMNSYLQGADYSDRNWWVAQYDAIRDTNVITGWQGLGRVVLKQYVGTTTYGFTLSFPKVPIRDLNSKERDAAVSAKYTFLHQGDTTKLTAARQARRGHLSLFGTVSGLDLSVTSMMEEQRILGDEPQDPCKPIQENLNGMVSSLGYLAKQAVEESKLRRSTSKYVKDYLARLYAEADAHGIQHA